MSQLEELAAGLSQDNKRQTVVLESCLKRIAELEAELMNAAEAIERAYSGLPSDRFPGPPTSIVEHMRAVARCKGK